MSCRKCIFPRTCENYDEAKCKDCEKYDDNAVHIGTPLLPEYACFKCKYNDTCVLSKGE